MLIIALVSVTYYLVGFGVAFGDGGNGFVAGSGFVPSTDELLAIGRAPFSWFGEIPAAAGYLFEVVFAGVALAIVWGAMAERTKLWVYFAFGVVFTLIYGPRLGRFRADGRPNSIPGHNMAFVTLGVIILWFGWFGFNAGSTLSVQGGGLGFFAYVALNTNVAAAAGVLCAVTVSWAIVKKPDLSMMLNGAIAALVAITAACAFVAPRAALVIGFGAGAIVVVGTRAVERARIDDPVGAIAAHGMAGVWGTLALGFVASPALAERLGTGSGGLLYTGSARQLGTQILGLLAVGVFTFGASFLALWAMKATFGIRSEVEAETAGLDVSEHGMWDYPELFTPVPGGYGSDESVPTTVGWRPTPVPEAG